MAEDFSDLYDFSTLTDDEIYDIVVQHLGEHPEVDAGWITVRVREGHVTLEGRVATDGEARVAEQVVAEVLGIRNFTNDLVQDELHRGDAPAAADDAAARDAEVADQRGEPNAAHSDTAKHLVEDLDSQSYGTRDVGEAVEEGASYTPPDRPVGDGYDSREDH